MSQTAVPEPTGERAAGDRAAEQQIAGAMAAGHESLSLECRADAARLDRLLAPGFHEFGASGRVPEPATRDGVPPGNSRDRSSPVL